jgi:release factor glutamine methyltransferase
MAFPDPRPEAPSAANGRSVRVALTEAARTLEPVSDSPRLDAELLMAHALGVTRESMILRHIGDPVPGGFESLLQRRLAHEPVAYITGSRAFWTIELAVGPGVLIPRPDSETLIEAAIEHFGEDGPATILDLGTGPGTLLLAALAQWPAAHGLGIDKSHDAWLHFTENVSLLDMDDRARFDFGDWAKGRHGQWDLILCNPPYIEAEAALPPDVAGYEPEEALFSGPDGLDDYRVIAPQLPHLHAPGGVACVEIGAGQERAVASLFARQGFTIASRRDLRGIVRCLVLTLERL